MMLNRFRRDESGAAVLQYVALCAFVAVVISTLLAAAPSLGQAMVRSFQYEVCKGVDCPSMAVSGLGGDTNGETAWQDGSCRVIPEATMNEYLTGHACPPAGFPYKPERRRVDGGMRMLDPHGECSAKFIGNTGRSFDFTNACLAHDYGYDLLRFLHRSGEHRREVDDLLAADTLANCETRKGFNKWSCKNWASAFSDAVSWNSRRQHYDPPTGSITDDR